MIFGRHVWLKNSLILNFVLYNQAATQLIIWHTQGSGKSLTMVYLIRKIRTIPALRRFKIVVVTDRTDLEKQLSDTAVLTGEPLQRAKNVKKLEEYLKQPGAGLVFGMIQKFKGGEDSEEEEQIEPIKKNLNPSEDILVLIDEAHRSHASSLHANLLEALPNCVRIGFTGTPIETNAQQTLGASLVRSSTSTTSANPKQTALPCPSSTKD
jgi:type I restriction enzyme R subunit